MYRYNLQRACRKCSEDIIRGCIHCIFHYSSFLIVFDSFLQQGAAVNQSFNHGDEEAYRQIRHPAQYKAEPDAEEREQEVQRNHLLQRVGVVAGCGCRNRQQDEDQQRADNLRRDADGERQHDQKDDGDGLVEALVVFGALGIKRIVGQWVEQQEHHQQEQDAQLEDASNAAYRVCSSRPQRLLPSGNIHGNPSASSRLLIHRIRFLSSLLSVIEGAKEPFRQETAPIHFDVASKYYVICLRHLIC